MKNSIFYFLVFIFISCEDDAFEFEPSVEFYSIEGKWLLESDSQALPNTMYEFNHGLRYTYYCDEPDCTTNYWNSLNTLDAIPGPDSYTFEEGLLTIDLGFGNEFEQIVQFVCDGNKVKFANPNYLDWIKLEFDQNNCD